MYKITCDDHMFNLLFTSNLKFSSLIFMIVILFNVILGRIDRKIEFPLPDEKTKRRIFQIHTTKMTLASDVDLEEYIMAKDDLSGADIKVMFIVCSHEVM